MALSGIDVCMNSDSGVCYCVERVEMRTRPVGIRCVFRLVTNREETFNKTSSL
jgi:hypothetical protein